MIGTTSAGTAATTQACIDLVYETAADALAIQYDESTQDCSYSLALYGLNYRDSGQQPLFFLRADKVVKTSATGECMTEQDAEYLVAVQSFPNGAQCPAVSVDDGETFWGSVGVNN